MTTARHALRWPSPAGAAVATAIAVLVAAAGCTGEDPGTAEFALPPGIAPAEQRLQFEWSEDARVPADARAAVDFAREWTYAYFLWNAEPTSISQYLHRHTGETMLGTIKGVTDGPPRVTGPVRITVVEVDVDGDTVTVGSCDDKRSLRLLDSQGHPRSESSGIIGPTWLRIVRSGTGWMAENRSVAPELRERCEDLRWANPAPTPIPMRPLPSG